METASAQTALEHGTALRLAMALDVPLPTLTGEFDLAESDPQPTTQKSCGCCG
ncbi:MAG: hypothetical protein MK180_16865 [Rhodobacteraceae bacterium]|nr:hypothetical protein [Paracoccaceae bacterium]